MILAYDRVWFDGERRLRGVCEDTRAAREAHQDVLLLAHFDQTLRSLHAELTRQSIEHHSYTGESIINTRENVFLGLASTFHPAGGPPQAEQRPRLEIIVAEHYPLPARDEAIIASARKLRYETRITFHVALTDRLIVHFCGERLQQLYRQLGADEETSLSHHFIDSAIRTAQQKIADRVRTELTTLSAEDWFRFNLRLKV